MIRTFESRTDRAGHVGVSVEASRSTERADQLIHWLRSYASDRINSRVIDERRCIPPHVVLDFGNRGMLGLQVSVNFGGAGLGHRDAMRVVEQLAAIDLSLATFTVNHNFLGIRPIQRYASHALCEELVPALAQGRELAAFALTEPGAGSNPQLLSASGVTDASGGWRLRGTKLWSGSASWAGVVNVFVKVLDGKDRPGRITGFAVRSGTPGLRHGPEALTMGMRGMVQNSIHLDDVPVKSDHLLGRVGAGMEAAQDGMTLTRLAIGAKSLGGIKRCLQLMHRYASRRSIATGRLLDNPITLARLSDLTAAAGALEALVAQICDSLDQGRAVPLEAYIACKAAGPELLWKSADGLVQLLGGRGYIETNIAPQLLRDARVFRIFEGPTETLNMFLGLRALHQGRELHRFLREELSAGAASDRLREAAEQINTRWSGATMASDPLSASRLASSLIGEVASYAILWAAAERAVSRSSSAEGARAVQWARRQFDESLARGFAGASSASELISPEEATAAIATCTQAIGDLEQALPGEDHELDALLRRERV
jgi:alkylation response protein AidB-like acyl-CoA dehydrogenase